MTVTVSDSILSDLRAARASGEGWCCGSFWYATYRPTFSQRISIDLKGRGYLIESRPCAKHEHKGTIHEYRLVGEPAPQQSRLVGIA